MADSYGAMAIPVAAPATAASLQYPTTFASWTAANVTATDATDEVTDPNGGAVASKIVESTDGGATVHSLSLAPSNDVAGYCQFSVSAQAGTRDWLKLEDVTAAASCYFDLANGVAGTASGATGTIADEGGGWYRCTLTYTDHTVGAAVRAVTANADGGDSYTGDGSALYLYRGKFYQNNATIVADPALAILGDYLQAFLRAYLQTAWQAIAPGTDIVQHVYTHDPQPADFDDKSLPALYLFRDGGDTQQLAADFIADKGPIRILWVFNRADQFQQADRAPFANGVIKMLHTALVRGRDANYILSGDPDSTAPSRGSVVYRHCKFWQERLLRPRVTSLTLEWFNGREAESLRFDAVVTELEVLERSVRDPEAHGAEPTEIAADIDREDGTTLVSTVGGHPSEAFGDPLEAFELDHTGITKTGDLIEVVPGWIDPDTYKLTATGTARPTYDATGLAGAPSMSLNGTAQRMICDALADNVDGFRKPWSMLLVLQWISHTSGRHAFSFGSSTDDDVYMAAFSDGADHLDLRRRDELSGDETAEGTADLSTAAIVGLSFDGRYLTSHVNEVREHDAVDVDVGNIPVDQFAVGCKRSTTDTAFGNFWLSALWFYDAALANEKIVGGSAELNKRWAIY